ncbi:MAG TPA: cellulose synthase operon protein YhjQ/BcsQ [Myxococcales bacterium]|jgi:cellulose biosynthesis protein BcsQ|nr:cellulose synthase operon protein YhjQ/BcsQ [Myxococcales bacterium]
MGPDVRHLLRFLRVPVLRYLDWSWPTSPQRPVAARRPFTTIAVVSLLNHVGRTTLCANFAAALGRAGWRAAAFDLDPRATLTAQLSKRPEVREIGFESHDEPASAGLVHWVGHDVGFVPFGQHPAATMELLSSECDVVVLDVPAGDNPTLHQALAEADEVVVVLRPDAESVHAVPTTEALLGRHRMRSWHRAAARYVVNGLDARRGADRESLAALRDLLGGRLCEPPIQEDRAAREALALGRFVDEQAPASQTVRDIAVIAREVIAAEAPSRGDHAQRTPVRPEKVAAKHVRAR